MLVMVEQFKPALHIGKTNTTCFVLYFRRGWVVFITYRKVQSFLFTLKMNVNGGLFDEAGAMLKSVLHERNEQHGLNFIGAITGAKVHVDEHLFTKALSLEVDVALEVFRFFFERYFLLTGLIQHVAHER